MNVRKLLLAIAFLLTLFHAQGQKTTNQKSVFDFVRQYHENWELSDEDVADVIINDQYVSNHNGIHHFYLLQRYKGVRIHNAIWGIHLQPNGKVVHNSVRFYKEISKKTNAAQPVLTARDALNKALLLLEAPPRKSSLLIQQQNQHDYLFAKGTVSQMDIPVRLNYYPVNDQLRLSWEVGIYPNGSSDYWSLQIDAQTGDVLEKINLTLHCTFEHSTYDVHSEPCLQLQDSPSFEPLSPPLFKGHNVESYKVFPAPVESPIHGQRQLLIDPADPLASPYGWLDTNGVAGPDFLTTKGNNAHAYFDAQNNNRPDGDEVVKEDLNFDFPYDPGKEPPFNKQAALTQLFYMSNFIHDFAYHYGFDENAGNFQNNNYNRGGRDRDEVLAEAMDGSGVNNANFLPLPDGNPNRMQMYLWNRKGSQLLTVESPSVIRGSFIAGTAAFGPSLDSIEITGEIVAAYDQTENPSLGCETLVNREEIKGKIALMYRGDCPFVQKVQNAQEAGAIAVIIANYNNSALSLGGTPTDTIWIPSIGISSSTAERIKKAADQRIVARLRIPKELPESLDASFDNGIIAHEYAHGISNRLTGGPSITGCLRNDEQMGEGWSDFFGLVLSTQSADLEQRTKGIGNFANGSQAYGGGIRRRPYSPIDQLNEFTYQDIINTTGPHPLGEVWASMLWDLYWAFSDEYGWDPDLAQGQGGNNMAIQLVMDGMKLQYCEPGFIDGRNAILKADSINNSGANQCLIWNVFAKRGLGWSATQGSSDNRKDGLEAFDVLPSCVQQLKISKEAINTSIEAGEPIRYRIQISNDKMETVSGITINDQLPEGASIVPFSVTGADYIGQNGNQISFEVDQILSGQKIQLQYLVETDPGLGSSRIFFDDFDDVGFTWQARARSGGRGWKIVTDTLRNFEKSWFVPNSQRSNTHLLELRQSIPINGRLPVVRFHHNYITEPISDAGFVEISTNQGQSWSPIPASQFLRNGYNGDIDFATILLLDQGGFWGKQPDFRETIIDLSSYIGEEVRLRFQFQSDSEPDENPFEDGVGWTIDDIEFMDLFYYDTEVCASSDQGDVVCARARELGTTVGSVGELTSTEEVGVDNNLDMSLYPNPTNDFLNIQINAKEAMDQVLLQLFATDGRLIQSKEQELLQGSQLVGMDVSQLPTGIYWLKLQHGKGIISKRLVKK